MAIAPLSQRGLLQIVDSQQHLYTPTDPLKILTSNDHHYLDIRMDQDLNKLKDLVFHLPLDQHRQDLDPNHLDTTRGMASTARGPKGQDP
jgi:hypothetical protein